MIQRAATVRTVDEKARTVDVVFSTGAAVRRYDWKAGGWYDEELEISASAIRMDRLNSGAPVLDSHIQRDMRSQIGVVERGWVENGRAMATIRFSRRPEADAVFRDVVDGIARNTSVGYLVHKYEVEKRSDGERERWIARDWEPMEVSMVTVPADAGAQVRSMEGMTMNDEDVAAQSREGETAEQRGIRLERTRQATIRANVRGAGLDDAFAIDLIERGVPVADANAAIVQRMSALHAEGGEIRSSHITVADRAPRIDATDLMSQAVAYNAAGVPLKDERARVYVPMRQAQIAREVAELRGVSMAGKSDGEVMERMLSTSDYPVVLQNASNLILRDSYAAAVSALKQIGRQASAPDFKARTHVSISSFPELRRVTEGAEFTYAGPVEAKESYSIGTSGRIVSLTRQALLNDALGAFGQMSRGGGIAAAHMEAEILCSLLTLNAAMSDGTELFHADHGNLLTGGGSALSVAGLTAARTAMRLQKDLNGKVIAVAPRFLIVPAALETTALQLTSINYVSAKTSDVNPFAGQLEVIVEPRLDAVSTTQWYLAASPSLVDGIEFAYLDGAQGPQTFLREGFDVDGIDIKVRLDFGAGVLDWRGLNRSNGS